MATSNPPGNLQSAALAGRQVTQPDFTATLRAALAEPCVAIRLVQTEHGGCADFDVEQLHALLTRIDELEARVATAQDLCARAGACGAVLRGEAL